MVWKEHINDKFCIFFSQITVSSQLKPALMFSDLLFLLIWWNPLYNKEIKLNERVITTKSEKVNFFNYHNVAASADNCLQLIVSKSTPSTKPKKININEEVVYFLKPNLVVKICPIRTCPLFKCSLNRPSMFGKLLLQKQ